MKRKNKLALGIVGLAAAALFVSGCTANFATNKEKARIAYALEPGISEVVVHGSVTEDESNKVYAVEDTNLDLVVKVTTDNGQITSYQNSGLLNDIIKSAKSSGIAVPSINYFVELDKATLKAAVNKYNADNPEGVIDLNNPNESALKLCLEDYGYLKYYNEENNNAYGMLTVVSGNLRNTYGYNSDKVASIDFENFYVSTLNSTVDKYRAVITVYDKVKYGNYNDTAVKLDSVSWKEAWGKGGHLIEGLIVYPVAWMVDSFAHAFAGGKNASPESIQAAYNGGGPQILSILVVTVIVRLFIFLCTFKSTLAQRKMTELQPELAKIQQKYPNSNTNQAQKQRLAEEQMRLYKKHKVNPLSQLLVLIIQFPVFIGVWGAMTGAAVLSTGKFLDLNLSASIWETLKVGPKAHPGWWTALVLILLMSVGQFFSMKIPQWIQKAKTKKVAKLGKNPAQTQQNRTANMISYVMLAMIIVMGFTLPAAMGVYWFVGAIVSMIQTVFTTVIFAGDRKKK